MQKPPDRSRLIIQMVIIWAASFFLLQYFGPKPPPTPAQTQSHLTRAQSLEAEGRKEQSNVAKADRVKKLEQAIGAYEEYYGQNKSSIEAMQTRFKVINIYDYLARLEGESTSTHWFDQAEAKLKEMAKAFHGRSGAVDLEIDGRKVRKTGDLAQIATERLNTIRAARDVRNEGRWTYRVLDVLVNLTGRDPGFSYFFALFLVVVVLKTLSYPFQKKQYQYQKDMMRIQPLLKEVQDEMKAKNRPPDEIQRRVMQVYKENDVNIAAGCLPMLVMMIVLFPVFWMVRDFEYQFTNGHFLWIGSGWSKTSPFIADNLAGFDVILFVVYLLSTVAYSLMQPKPADAQQAQQQKMMMIMMPVVFGVMMWMYEWSSAFMLYWLILNVVSMYQSWKLNREFGMAKSGTSGTGGGAVAVAPAEPLEPMDGVHTKSPNGKSGRNGRHRSPGAPGGRTRPKGSGRR